MINRPAQPRVRRWNTGAAACATQARFWRGQKNIPCPIEIISGQEEGRLVYLSVAYGSQDQVSRRLVIDFSRDSTEVVLGQHLRIEDVESFDIGTGPVNKGYFADGSITASAFTDAVETSRRMFATQSRRFAAHQWRTAYGSSGAIRAIQ